MLTIIYLLMLPRRAEAISLSKIIERASSHFTTTFIRSLEKELQRESIVFRFQQIEICDKIYIQYYQKPVNEIIILDIFEIQKNQYNRDKVYVSSPIKSIAKKTALDEHQEANLIDVIKQHYLDYSPLRKYEIFELAQKISNKSLSDS